jgi:hypothetical protein
MKRYLFILALVLVSCGGEVIVEPVPTVQELYWGKAIFGLFDNDGTANPEGTWLDLRKPKLEVVYRHPISGGTECRQTEETIVLQTYESIAIRIKVDIYNDDGTEIIDTEEYLITYNLANMDESDDLPKGIFVHENLKTGFRNESICYFVPPEESNCP